MPNLKILRFKVYTRCSLNRCTLYFSRNLASKQPKRYLDAAAFAKSRVFVFKNHDRNRILLTGRCQTGPIRP